MEVSLDAMKAHHANTLCYINPNSTLKYAKAKTILPDSISDLGPDLSAALDATDKHFTPVHRPPDGVREALGSFTVTLLPLVERLG